MKTQILEYEPREEATGMGFWVARYAVREHGGQLEEFEDVVRAVHIRLPLGKV